MYPATTVKSLVSRAKVMLWPAKQIPQMVLDPQLSRSYYPTHPRKSKARILLELTGWLLLRGEFNQYYYVYGLDRREGVRMGDYLSYRAFSRIRDRKNATPKPGSDYNYLCLINDKFVFSQFLASLKMPTPRNLAVCDAQEFTWLGETRPLPLAEAFRDQTRRFDGFCKPLIGRNGRAAFPLRLEDGRLFVNAEEIGLEGLRARLRGKHLIQERVRQHPEMSRLHPSSINTIRLITFNNGGVVEPFSAALRMGTKGRTVDNWTAGGILVGVDLSSGRVRGKGFYKPGYGGEVRVHPQTEVVFEGFQIPRFAEAVALAKELHGYLPGIHSIGWDLAIGEEGPTIIEANSRWDGAIPMALEPNFRERFLAMYRD
jgi:hypothetical protein